MEDQAQAVAANHNIDMVDAIGIKVIKAFPMNREDYNKYRGWKLPENESGADEGYLVGYTDGGAPNMPNHAGYVSWSPKEQFENAYRPMQGMSFSLALEMLKYGKKIQRAGWRSKNYAVLDTAPGHEGLVLYFDEREGEMHCVSNIWAPSVTCMLANDWQVVA